MQEQLLNRKPKYLSFLYYTLFLDSYLYSHLLWAKKISKVRETSMLTVLYIYAHIKAPI